ncbi:AfsR/SARP family transcriptional regulator [Herbidospora sp. RD11066]
MHLHNGGTLLIRMLGTLTVIDDSGRPIEMPQRKVRHLLAILVTHRNTAVSSGRLIERLWRGDPPASARSNLNTYLARLRRLLPNLQVRTMPSGYVFGVMDHELDAAIFTSRTARAADASRRGLQYNAIAELEQALQLWSGDPFEGLDLDCDTSALVEQLNEEYRRATEDLFDLRLTLGRHTEIIGGLRSWADRHPLRERAHSQLMVALHRDGRQSEALHVYEQLRRRLIEQIGAEPTLAVRELYIRMLGSDPDSDSSTSDLIVQNSRYALPPPSVDCSCAKGVKRPQESQWGMAAS